MNIPTWAILKAAGVEDGEEAFNTLVRAQRIANNAGVDGKYEYVPKTLDYAAWQQSGMRPGGPLVLRNLEVE